MDVMGFIKRIVFHILATAGVLWGIEHYILADTFIIEGGWQAYPLIAFSIGCLNVFVKPLLNIVTLPIHFLSLGLSSVVVNAFVLWLVTQALIFLNINGVALQITELPTYVIAAICLSLANVVLHWFEK